MGFAPIGRSVKSSAGPPGERRFEPAVGEGHRDVQSRVITCWLFFFLFSSLCLWNCQALIPFTLWGGRRLEVHITWRQSFGGNIFFGSSDLDFVGGSLGDATGCLVEMMSTTQMTSGRDCVAFCVAFIVIVTFSAVPTGFKYS